MGYDNLLFDQFIYGASLDNTNLIKPEVTNIWFEHTENEYERAMFRAYNNIDYVNFLNIIDLEIINNFIVELWNVYKRKYTYSSKEDFIKSVWQFTIYQIEDFLKETYYPSGYNCKGFELWFCNDKNDITNNLWFFLDEDKDPDYYKQYYKKVLELLISFKGVNSKDNTKEPPLEPKTPFTDPKSSKEPPLEPKDLLTTTQKEIIDKLIIKGFLDVHIFRFLRDEKNFITITQKQFNLYMNENYNRNYKPDKRITALKDISIPIELDKYFNEITP